MKAELKPCPFCGKRDKTKIYTESMAQHGKLLWIRYGVKCSRCHFGIPTFTKEDAAISKWNTRPVEDEMYWILKRLVDMTDYAELVGVIYDAKAILKKARGER